MSILERALLYYDPYELCDLCFGIEIAMCRAIIPDWIVMPICSPKSGKIALSPQCNCWQSLWIGLRCLQAVFNLGKMPSFHNGTDEVFTLETNCDVLAVLFGTE